MPLDGNQWVLTLGYGDVDTNINTLLGEMTAELKSERLKDWLEKTQECNKFLAKHAIPVTFLEADLEYSALSKVRSVSKISKRKYDDEPTKNELLKRLGSKGVDCKVKNDAFKAPWLRGFIGENVPAKELSDCVQRVLKEWGQAASSEFDLTEFILGGETLYKKEG